jgi:hypothetical protein
MKKSVVTRVLFATAAASVTLSAFTAPLSSVEMTAMQNRQQDQMVIGTVIAAVFTGQSALRGIVMADSTIPPLLDEQLNDRNSGLVKTHFPQHVQIVPLVAKDFAKPKKAQKIDRVLLDVPKNKIDFETFESLKAMGLSPENPTDSSWRVFKAKYPDATNFVAFSNPGYDSGRDMAIVSYFNLCGPGCYQKGYALLERDVNTRRWRMVHRNVTFGGG